MVTSRLWGTGHSMRSPLSYAPCKDTCPPSRYDNNLRPVAPSALSAEPSRVPPPRRRPSIALGSPWPKSLTLPTSRGHMDLVIKMPIGNQLRLRLRLLVISCLLYPLPFICLELSREFQSVVSNCMHTSICLNDGHFGRHPGFILKLRRDCPELLVYYSVPISGAILKIPAC